MGNYFTKPLTLNDGSGKDETNLPSNAKETIIEEEGMHTPSISRRNISIDPRSATVGIDRTPIQVDCTPDGFNTSMMTAIPRHLRRRTRLEGDIDTVIPILTPKTCFKSKFVEECTSKKNNETEQTHLIPSTETSSKLLTPTDIARYRILGLDPRSPAANFERTPILLPKSMEILRTRSHELLNRRGSYEVDMCSKFSYCETLSPFDMTEIQALPDMAAQVLQHLNLIDIDCDYNSDESNSSSSEDSPIIKTISKSGEDDTSANNSGLILDLILAKEKILTLGKERLKTRDNTEMDHLKQNNCSPPSNETVAQQKLIYTNDSDRIKVWRDSSSEETEDSKFVELDSTETDKKETMDAIKEEVIVTYDDNDIVKGTLLLKAVIGDNEYQKKTEVIEKKKHIKFDIKIMGDDKKIFYSDTKNGNDSPKTRTPLGNRSNNGKMLLTKSPQQLFRNKGIRPKMLQENTPPRKLGNFKSRLSSVEWDPDENVII